MIKKKSQNSKKISANISSSQVVRILLAVIILALILSQLFTFEKFPSLLASMGVSSGWAVLLVVAELFALPFLLGMKLPTSILRVGGISCVATMILLTALESMAYENGISVIFGATFELPGGSWSLLFLAAMWAMLIWAVWDNLVAFWTKISLPKKRKVTKKSKRN